MIKAAQTLGLTLQKIQTSLQSLSDQRIPTKRDRGKLSSIWKKQLDEKNQSHAAFTRSS